MRRQSRPDSEDRATLMLAPETGVSGMVVLEALAKGAAAGVTVAAILLLRPRFSWAGVLVVMPVITASTFLFVGLGDGTQAARKLAFTALLAIPTVLVFIAAMYACLSRFNVVTSLLVSSALWVVTATGITWLTR